MPESDQGWTILVERLRDQQDGAQRRTYGKYSVSVDGTAVDGLSGFVCESRGPGDNGPTGKANHRRIAAGAYPLSTHFGKYVTIGYSTDASNPAPMPAILVGDTGDRTAILIHPGHPPKLYLSSIGCLNLTGALAAAQDMTFTDSRDRVIAVIESLRSFRPDAFDTHVDTPIRDAKLVVID